MPVRKPPQIVTMSDFDESINALVFGDSGCGKTVLSGSAGLILSVESGTISAKRQGSKAEVWPITDWPEVEKAYAWLADNPGHGYDWVAVDSITRMQRLAELWWMGKIVDENTHRDMDLLAQQDYLKVQNITKRFCELFCDLPCNVLFTALPMLSENSQGDEKIMPQIHGQRGATSQYVCGLMSCVGHMAVKRIKRGTEVREARRIVWKTVEPYFGKDRYDVLAPHTDDITLPGLKAMIDGDGPTRTTKRRVTTRKVI